MNSCCNALSQRPNSSKLYIHQEFYSGAKSPLVPHVLLHMTWQQAHHLAGYEQQVKPQSEKISFYCLKWLCFTALKIKHIP